VPTLFLYGHKHFYERESAIGAGGVTQEITNNPAYPWCIVSGGAGHYDGLDTPTLSLAASSRKLIDTRMESVHGATALT
jgi:acid phosphatase type 7